MGSIEVPMAVKEIIKMEERSPQNTKQYKTCDKSFEKEINLKIHNEFAQGHKKEEFPFQTKNIEISSEDENWLYPNVKDHRNTYSDKKENCGKKDKNFPSQTKNSEISSQDENFPFQSKSSNKGVIIGNKDEHFSGSNGRNNIYNKDKKKVNGNKGIK